MNAERILIASDCIGDGRFFLDRAAAYAKERVQFGKPIGEFQLIQEKLARMEVARMNLQNLVFRVIEGAASGRGGGSGG